MVKRFMLMPTLLAVLGYGDDSPLYLLQYFWFCDMFVLPYHRCCVQCVAGGTYGVTLARVNIASNSLDDAATLGGQLKTVRR